MMFPQTPVAAAPVRSKLLQKVSRGFMWALILGLGVTTAFAQTITANFQSRNGTTHSIPPRIFGINGVTSLDDSTLTQLQQAGLTEARAMASIPVVYASNTPNWSQFDWTMNLLQSQGLHPLVTLLGSPTWLQPAGNPCASSGSPSYYAPPTNVNQWANIAASYVAHLDANFPGLVHDFEIWNEPELQKSFCVSDNLDATRLSTYLSLYAAAASAMHAQATQDGSHIRVGGPVVSNFKLALEWIPALLSNPGTYPYADFISYHMYLTGQTQINDGMNWSQLYAFTQSSTRGESLYFLEDTKLIRAGQQVTPKSTPIYVTEFNDNWVFAQDCCRNDPTYGPLWNSVAIVDFLNTIYAGANSVPTKLFYFAGSAPPYFCIVGQLNASMNCDPSELSLYPQYYSYMLLASPSYLNLTAGGHMAESVTDANSQTGLLATAFYTTGQDSIVLVNPTGSAYSSVTVMAQNPGYTAATATEYTLNKANPKIASKSLALTTLSTGFQATISVPAYSTVAISVVPTN
jgi:glycosyl hydrolase family 39 (putative alpha-L-iduronidase)